MGGGSREGFLCSSAKFDVTLSEFSGHMSLTNFCSQTGPSGPSEGCCASLTNAHSAQRTLHVADQ